MPMTSNVAINEGIVLDIVNLPHLPRPLHRAYRINGVLAYMLPRMLVTLSWIHETLPDLQADYCSNRPQENIFVINGPLVI